MFFDKPTIEIISFSLSSIGLFNFVTKYDVPEIRKTFYGKNLFQEKADIIHNVLNWFYVIPTLFGLFLLPIREIFSNEIPERLIKSNLIYLVILLLSIIISIYIFRILTKIGKLIAKRKWEPKVIVEFIPAVKIIEGENLLNQDINRAKDYIEKIETALEIKPIDKDLFIRFKNIQNIFNN